MTRPHHHRPRGPDPDRPWRCLHLDHINTTTTGPDNTWANPTTTVSITL